MNLKLSNHKPEAILTSLGLIVIAAAILYHSFSMEWLEVRSGDVLVTAEPTVSDDKSRYAVDVNKTTKEELMGVRYISPSIAEAIIAYRAENGRFIREDDLLRVDGIGEVTLQNLKPYIKVE